MGACGIDLNCTASGVVHANADLAGNGVLAAFIVSAMMTITAVVYGFLSDSLPEWYLNEFDKNMISYIQASATWFSSRKTIQQIVSAGFRLRSWIRKHLKLKDPRPPVKLSRLQRQEAITRFILSLSDQQLVTGLAILVATLFNRCTLSVQDFRITFSLAWFSSTTHLATLDSLRDYFILHRTIRNWRIFGMTAMLALMIACLEICIRLEFAEPDVPAMCPVDSHDTLIYVDNISWILMLVLLVWNYIFRIIHSYSTIQGTISGSKWFAARVANIVSQIGELSGKIPEMTESEREAVINEMVKEIDADRRLSTINKMKRIRKDGVPREPLLLMLAADFHRNSFLCLFPSIAFMISFGFAQLRLFRWNSQVYVQVDPYMGFGQITSIFLLILPIFAAAEIYYESKTRLIQPTEDNNGIPASTYTHSSPSRSSSFQVVLSPNIDSAEARGLEQDGKAYDELLPQISNFFYVASKELSKAWNSATEPIEITEGLRVKRDLLLMYREIEATQRRLPSLHGRAFFLFFVRLLWSITLGVLLNTDDSTKSAAFIGFMLLTLRIGYGSFYFIQKAFLSAKKVTSKKEVERVLADLRLEH